MQFPDAVEFCLCLRVTGSLGFMVHLPPVILGQGESVIGHGPVTIGLRRVVSEGRLFIFICCMYISSSARHHFYIFTMSSDKRTFITNLLRKVTEHHHNTSCYMS